MTLPEAFEKLTHLLRKPRWALEELHCALLRGQVRSLRRRILNDEGDAELNCEFWSDIELKFLAPNAPERKRAVSDPSNDEVAFPKARERDVIWLGPDPDKDVAPDIIAQGDIFYIHRADCAKVWPELAPPADRTAKNAPLSKQLDDVIREEIRRARKEARAEGKKPPNRNEICKIVQPRIRERGPLVAYDQIKQIDKEPEFANRQKTGVRFNK